MATRLVGSLATAWGDPDLKGVWSSDDTAGIPLCGIPVR
jgi:hypothetical protein